MATLTVWKFDTATGAQDALDKLADLSKQQLIQIQDAAIVSGRRARKTEDQELWQHDGSRRLQCRGMLFGLIFFSLLPGCRRGDGCAHRQVCRLR
jgi:uncharacterized membrane protein